MRSIGKGFVEFKKGLKGVKDEVDEVEGDIKNIEDKDVDVK
jgi:Sec-independent protein translocase protein TatA